MTGRNIIETLTGCGLKITPQRIAVLEALVNLQNHPTAENIIEYIKSNHPNIATGTVYKTLDTFGIKKIINKVKTENDIMRYDAIQERHHHLYCNESDRIEDFYDNELDTIIEDYLRKKNIPNFQIEDIKLHLVGRFTDNENK